MRKILTDLSKNFLSSFGKKKCAKKVSMHVLFCRFFFHTDFGVKFKINSNSSLIFFFFFFRCENDYFSGVCVLVLDTQRFQISCC